MIYSDKDPFNAANRYDILMHEKDAAKLGIREGESIVAYNRHGMIQGRAKFADVKQGNVAVYWPEGNVLIPKGIYETYAQIPEYNTIAIIEKAETFHAQKDQKYVEKRIEELEMSVE
jgi:anaerobic selenocysteine-containing dehydrogenase